ncbi:MAG: response regulator transcription factor [Candidatus Cyclonatronum sp.]|uniref:response regulator n=1 Tax=Cyclonatronum sp. TaxID=3024185 RepID=UPI0025C63771|nr:response regulator transcription factor [Cyclonatronum sp.]MCC5933366.1 response regulator transcription factor [Balneolales bacterium]MCH8486583.1 response regulator transcription factor [Cyclonatronum sp.]
MKTLKSEVIVRVCIVEDDDHIRELYIGLLEKSAGFRCVGGYSNAEDALSDIPLKKPDLVLMDINLPGASGISCTQKLKAQNEALLIVMLTVYEDTAHIFDSLAAGAVGYLLKSAKQEEVLEALHLALNGGAPMSAQIARKVVQSFRKSKTLNELEELTSREHEVLTSLASGLQNKEIAQQMFVSIDTIKTHIRNIYRKLEVRTRTEAVVKFIDNS